MSKRNSKPVGDAKTHTRYRDIVRSLREDIQDQRLKPGQQLLTATELQHRFRTTRLTVLRAVAQLARDGYLRTEPRRGTFVAEQPPHLHDYALVFPGEPCAPGYGLWSRFYAGLVNQAAALSQKENRRVIPFYNMDWPEKAREYPRLLERVQSHRLAGIIFTSPMFRLEGTPVLDQPGIPRVMLMSEQRHPHVPVISSAGAFLPKALDYLAARGRKRIATITFTTNYAEQLAEVRELVSARGLTLHPCGFMAFHGQILEGVRAYVQLLMQAKDRPDGLIVGDDNMVEHATAGLIAAGVRVGEDLDVVAHCNFPWAGPTVLPLKRLGFDSRTVLRTCIELIDRQRRGEVVSPVTKIEAKFEEELETMTGRDREVQFVETKGATT